MMKKTTPAALLSSASTFIRCLQQANALGGLKVLQYLAFLILRGSESVNGPQNEEYMCTDFCGLLSDLMLPTAACIVL